MREFLARRVALPLHEWMLGRPTPALLRELQESQWYAPDEIRALQQSKLSRLLEHAAKHSPFYHRRLERAGVLGAQPGTDAFDVLTRLPVLTKDEIRTSLHDIAWHDAPGGLYPSSTGGSTGEPLQFFLDRRRQACDLAARLRSHLWFGVPPAAREVFLWGSPIENTRTTRLRRWRDRMHNHVLLNAFDMSAVRMDRYLAAMERFQPRAIFGYPSSVALLARHAKFKNRPLSLPGLRVVFVTGEVCDPHTRDTIRSCFNVPVADGYGSREAGFIAHQCPLGSMHMTSEHVVVEVLGDDGLPVRDGVAGRLIVTHLESHAMPLIRYDTGDRGKMRGGFASGSGPIRSKRCACGRGLATLEVVEGRATDFIHLPDGTVRHALSVIYPLRECPAIRQFRVVQHEDYSVSVDIAPHGAPGAGIGDQIAASVRTVLAADVPVRVTFTDQIHPSPSGKYRFVESRALCGDHVESVAEVNRA